MLLLSLFAVIVSAGAVQADLPTTLLAGPSAWGALGPCLPIMLLALVWHDLLPVIVDRLGGCRATIRWV